MPRLNDIAQNVFSLNFFMLKFQKYEKVLDNQIIEFLSILIRIFVRFYEPERSLVGDPDLGPILASLVVGPCALEFSRVHQADTYW